MFGGVRTPGLDTQTRVPLGAAGLDTFRGAVARGGGIDTWRVSRSGDHAPLGADGRRDLGRGRLRDRDFQDPRSPGTVRGVATASQLEVGPLPVRTEAPPL